MNGCVGKLKDEKMIRYKRDEWPYGRKVEGLRNGRMMEKWVKGKKGEGKINRKIGAEWMNRFLIR